MKQHEPADQAGPVMRAPDSLSHATQRYGYKWGPVFWRANVSVAARMFGEAGWELRWIGVAIPFTNWGFGFLWKTRVQP